jgi:hypothetical protein
MPPGAGKTESMLALLVNQRLPRLLIVVLLSELRGYEGALMEWALDLKA